MRKDWVKLFYAKLAKSQRHMKKNNGRVGSNTASVSDSLPKICHPESIGHFANKWRFLAFIAIVCQKMRCSVSKNPLSNNFFKFKLYYHIAKHINRKHRRTERKHELLHQEMEFETLFFKHSAKSHLHLQKIFESTMMCRTNFFTAE